MKHITKLIKWATRWAWQAEVEHYQQEARRLAKIATGYKASLTRIAFYNPKLPVQVARKTLKLFGNDR